MKSLSGQLKWQLILSALALSTITILGGSCGMFNNNPVISDLGAEKDWVELSGSSKVECVASDPDGDELTYSWEATDGNFSGQGSIVTWTAPDIPGTSVITVTVTDDRGGEASMQLSLEARANNPPIIESLTAERMLIKQTESTLIECVASDPDGDELTYSWEATGGNVSGQGSNVTWSAPNKPGTYAIIVRVIDDRGGEATMQLTIDILVNHPPIIESLTAERMLIKQTESTLIECVASDPDGDELTYLWEATDGSISGQGPAITWTGPETCATYVVTVTVADGRGGEASKELSIKVQERPG